MKMLLSAILLFVSLSVSGQKIIRQHYRDSVRVIVTFSTTDRVLISHAIKITYGHRWIEAGEGPLTLPIQAIAHDSTVYLTPYGRVRSDSRKFVHEFKIQ